MSITSAQAAAKLQAGLTLVRGKDLGQMPDADLLAARRNLAEAYDSGHLAGSQDQACREALGRIADETIFSKRICKDDPYAFQHKVPPERNCSPRSRRTRN